MTSNDTEKTGKKVLRAFTDADVTTFVLGEMNAQDAEEFRAAMRENEALASEVEATLALTNRLGSALMQESLPKVDDLRRARVEQMTRRRMPNWKVSLAPLAAASIALVVLAQHRGWIGGPPKETSTVEHSTTSDPKAPEAVLPRKDGGAGGAATVMEPIVAESKKVHVEHPKAEGETTYADDAEQQAAEPVSAPEPAPAVAQLQSPKLAAPSMASNLGKTMGAERALRRAVAAEAVVDGFGGARGSGISGGRAKVATGEVRKQKGTSAADEIDQGGNTEAFDRIVDNEFLAPSQHPLSTFSIDVDTAAYASVRRFITSGKLPPPDVVRIEEMVNYFPYSYEQPKGDDPFATNVEIVAAPWKPEHRLVRIGLKAREIDWSKRPASNLVFLLDVSGSMNDANKLPLLVESLKLVVNALDERDRMAIVVYAGASGLVLPSTRGSERGRILEALERLEAGGSTNGAAGIELAYATAAQGFIKGGINRVILATDGDFNVGVTSQGDLIRMIEDKAKTGVFLSVLGFGMGNYKDSTLEKLSGKGNGNYAYIDTIQEARKVLVEQAGGTMITVAKDVKIQVEFNPAEVSAYRLIGYENRLLAAQDFNDDTKDAGEIGAGHTVTALYEVVPKGVRLSVPGVDPLRYQTQAATTSAASTGELMTLKLRYKAPDGDKSKLMSYAIRDRDADISAASDDLQFAAGVAAFGLVLRDSKFKGNATLGLALDLAGRGKGSDKNGYRAEFIELVRKAQSLPKR